MSVLKRKAAGVWTPVDNDASSVGGVLAETVVDATSQTNKDATSSSYVDFDALATVTFVVPSSGNVKMEMRAQINNDGSQLDWGLWDSSAGTPGDLANSTVTANYDVNGQTIGVASYLRKITGLTPGATQTYKWRVKRTAGASLCRTSYGGAAGAALMRVTLA